MVKRTRSKSRRGLVTYRIVFTDRTRPQARPQELTVNVQRTERIEKFYAAAIVATRTSIALADVKIVDITE